MRHFLSIFLYTLTLTLWTHTSKGQTCSFVNPNGLYEYDGKTYKKNGETYGYSGTIKVLLLDTNKILVSFYVCKGAPSYNSGSFVDTLNYSKNQAVYRGDTTIADFTCRLTFLFTPKGIDAELFSDNPNWACGFGHAVDAQGFYKRAKGKVPSKEDILKDKE
jgi:hypothetical protein